MAVASDTVARYSAWVASVTDRRDESHGIEHFERVRVSAVELAEETLPLSSDARLLLELAALSHDVLDHKYVGEDAEALRAAMEEALTTLAGINKDQVRAVCLVAENISLSKELRGELDVRGLQQCECLTIRDLVSDADKLDALGLRGLKRLAQYQAHALRHGGMGTRVLTQSFLRRVASDHLLHRVNYLKTPAARARGQALLRETIAIMNSDAALQTIITEAVQAGADLAEGVERESEGFA